VPVQRAVSEDLVGHAQLEASLNADKERECWHEDLRQQPHTEAAMQPVRRVWRNQSVPWPMTVQPSGANWS